MYLLVRRPSVFVAVLAIVLEGIVTLCASLYPRSEYVLSVGTVFGASLLVVGLLHPWAWHVTNKVS